nr:hypothetical protein CFP56_51488 [Quercus suber]
MGLLELKAYLKSNTNYTKALLPPWVYNLKSECCNWEQVKCDDTTGYVIKLWLSNINHETHVYAGSENWFLNESLLLPFKELKILDLSHNGIRGWQGNKGYRFEGIRVAMSDSNGSPARVHLRNEGAIRDLRVSEPAPVTSFLFFSLFGALAIQVFRSQKQRLIEITRQREEHLRTAITAILAFCNHPVSC